MPAVSPSLVYHAGALGDFVTCLPAFAAWRRLHPAGPLVLLGKPAHVALCAGSAGSQGPLFSGAWDAGEARFAGLFSPEGPGAAAGVAVEAFGDLDSALLFCGASSPLARNLGSLVTGEIRRQDPFPPAGVPVVDFHLSLFPELTFTEEQRLPRVVPGVEAHGAAEKLVPRGECPVVLHPGSGSPRKNWPEERFRELASRFRAAGETVAWVLGPAEAGFAPPAGDTELRDLPLSVLAALLARSRLTVGNDSGVAHLAAATGAPCVVLFAVSAAAPWAPRGKRVRVLDSRGAGMDAITLREVWAACERYLGK